MNKIKNLSESIRAKLFNISKNEKIDFNLIILRYLQESFLYRLSISQYKNNFLLKGGLLKNVDSIHRITIDGATDRKKKRNKKEKSNDEVCDDSNK